MRRGAGGDDQRVAGIAACIANQQKWFLFQLGGVDVVENDFGVEALRMFLKTLHQFRPLHSIEVGWPVIHFGGGHQLASLRHSCNQHRVQIGACCIDGGGVTGGAGAEYEEAMVLGAFFHDGAF